VLSCADARTKCLRRNQDEGIGIFLKKNLNYEFYILLCVYIRVLRRVIIVVVRKKERIERRKSKKNARLPGHM